MDDDIINFINKSSKKSTSSRPTSPLFIRSQNGARSRRTTRHSQSSSNSEESFSDFQASHLMCSQCKKAMPVQEKILLYLPSGTLFGYFCTSCHTQIGTRTTGG